VKLPLITYESINKFGPCHNIEVYGPAKDCPNDALKLMRWVDEGKTTTDRYMWCVLITECIPEELLIVFTKRIMKEHLGDRKSDLLEAHDLYLNKELTLDELKQEQSIVQSQLDNKEHSLLVYRHERFLSRVKRPLLDYKCNQYEKEFALLTTEMCGSNPSIKHAALDTFRHLYSVDKKYGKICLNKLKQILMVYTKESKPKKKRWWDRWRS